MKKTYSFRIDEGIAEAFRRFVFEKYGKLYDALGQELQNAIAAWMAQQGLTAHTNTHKINPGMPRVQQKIDGVIAWLREQGFSNQFSLGMWEKGCVHIVGSDERTIRKYLEWAKRLGKVKHYAGAVWEIV